MKEDMQSSLLTYSHLEDEPGQNGGWQSGASRGHQYKGLGGPEQEHYDAHFGAVLGDSGRLSQANY
jgi:hypothetical protein